MNIRTWLKFANQQDIVYGFITRSAQEFWVTTRLNDIVSVITHETGAHIIVFDPHTGEPVSSHFVETQVQFNRILRGL